MEFELIGGVAAVPVIIALVAVIKAIFPINTKYAPVVAIALGLVASFGLEFFGHLEAYNAVVMGIVAGLTAVGLYSGTKNTIEGIRKIK